MANRPDNVILVIMRRLSDEVWRCGSKIAGLRKGQNKTQKQLVEELGLQICTPVEVNGFVKF
jgi:hypothetical protein